METKTLYSFTFTQIGLPTLGCPYVGKLFCEFFCPIYLEGGEHCADYMVSKITMVHTRIVWEYGFPQRLGACAKKCLWFYV